MKIKEPLVFFNTRFRAENPSAKIYTDRLASGFLGFLCVLETLNYEVVMVPNYKNKSAKEQANKSENIKTNK